MRTREIVTCFHLESIRPIMPTELEEVRDISIKMMQSVLIMVARWIPPPW